MRVVVTAESYLPYLSGVTVSTEALARGLAGRGHEVLLVAPRPARGEPGTAGAIGADPQYAWLPAVQLPRPVPPDYRVPIPWAGGRALAAALAFRPDVIHAQSPFVSGRLALALARRASAPLVFTHHTRFADYRHYLGPLGRPLDVAIEAWVTRFWRSCDAVVAPSSDLAAEIAAALADRRLRRRPRIRVIPTGIDTAALRDLSPIDPRPAAGWPGDAIVVVSLGRLASEKSVDVVLEAVARARRRVPALRLLLVGGGPAEPKLRRRAAAADLADAVAFSRRRPRHEALALARGGDMLAFASRTETQGLVLAEALALGLPVVALEGPGVRDSVRSGIDGIVVPRTGHPARALGDALAALAADATRRGELGRSAIADAGRFDATRRLAELEDLYHELRASAGAAG